MGAHGVDEGFQRARALAVHHGFLVVVDEGSAHLALLALSACNGLVAIAHQRGTAVWLQIVGLEGLPQVIWEQLLAGAIGQFLDDLPKLDLQRAWQIEGVFLFQDVGDSALAGLAVDADHALVGAAHIGRIDGQVGHFPVLMILLRQEAFLDGVLVGAGKGSEDQLARIGVSGMDGKLGAAFRGAHHGVDVGKIKPGFHALGIEVQGQGNQIHVAGALPIAEQCAFHAIGAGHEALFGGCHRRAPVVVGMQAQDDRLAPAEMAVHPFDLVSVDVGWRHLHCGRQIDDAWTLGCGLPDIHDRLADLQGIIQLGAGEAFGRILEYPFGFGVAGCFVLEQQRTLDGQCLDGLAVRAEHHPALQLGGGIVHMDDGTAHAAQGSERLFHQLLAGLHQHLDSEIVRDQLLFDQFTAEGIVGLGGGGKADLDLPKTNLHQQIEQTTLALAVQGLDQGLIAIAQVDAAPCRGPGDDLVGPGAILERHDGKGAIFAGW